MITNSLFVQYVSFSLCFSFSKTATAACRLSTIAGCFSIHTKKEPRIWQNIKQNLQFTLSSPTKRLLVNMVYFSHTSKGNFRWWSFSNLELTSSDLSKTMGKLTIISLDRKTSTKHTKKAHRERYFDMDQKR